MIQVMDRFEEEKETMAAAYAAKMDQMMEKNKDVIYTFINALTDKKVKDKQEG